MIPLETRQIGRTDIFIPVLGLGGAALGNLYQRIEETTAELTIHTALNSGIRYLDTAPLYGHGLSERRFGAVLQKIPRGNFVLSTKVGYRLDPTSSPVISDFVQPDAYKVAFDFSRKSILDSIANSRKRLGLDYIDIIYIHDPDEGATMAGKSPYAHSHFKTVMDEAYPALVQLREQGEIGAIGVGINQWEMLVEFAKSGDFDCFLLAGRYTLLEQEALDTLLPLCQSKKISIIIGGPYNSGILAAAPGTPLYYNYMPAPAEVIARVKKLQEICEQYKVAIQAAALQFPLAHPAVACIIPGARSPEELIQNINYLHEPISPEFWKALKTHDLIKSNAPVPSG